MLQWLERDRQFNFQYDAIVGRLIARLPFLRYSGVYDLVQTLRLEGRITMQGVVVRIAEKA